MESDENFDTAIDGLTKMDSYLNWIFFSVY
jgi:hypothetical protein